MTALRKLVVQAWRGNRTGWAEKYLMERLAKAGGEVDTVIAVHAADLTPNGHTHLLIARELDTAGRPDEALTWAERGIREARDLAAVDTALVDHLCERFTQAARLPDAVALRRDHFGARRSRTVAHSRRPDPPRPYRRRARRLSPPGRAADPCSAS